MSHAATIVLPAIGPSTVDVADVRAADGRRTRTSLDRGDAPPMIAAGSRLAGNLPRILAAGIAVDALLIWVVMAAWRSAFG